MAHGNIVHWILQWFGFCQQAFRLTDIKRPVYVEFEITHQSQMIPQFLFGILAFSVLGEHVAHDSNDGFGTMLTLIPIGNTHGIIHHVLDFPSIFGNNQLFTLGIII